MVIYVICMSKKCFGWNRNWIE